jgi:signal transduction histidine kinase
MRNRLPQVLIRYGEAVLYVTIALLVTLLLWPLVKPFALPLFLGAILISAWRGGKWVGTFSAILARVTIDAFFSQYHAIGVWDDISRIVTFGLEGFLLSWLIDSRKQVLAELRHSREQLRALSTHLQSAIEEERTRIAREIHDELGQELTGLKFDLCWLRDQVANRTAAPEPELMEDKLNQTLKRIDSTIHSVRRMATELRPAVLDTLGLNAAVEWQARDFESRTGIKCELNANLEDLSLERETSTAIFRIVQESLTNIARHAEASEVRVALVRNDGFLELQIQDDGKGIDEASISGVRSLGILGMQERVNLLHGEMSVAGRDRKGTLVDVRIPLAHNGTQPAADSLGVAQ